MIACDKQTCRFTWYHYQCVGLDNLTIPDGEWLRSECNGYFNYLISFYIHFVLALSLPLLNSQSFCSSSFPYDIIIMTI